MKNFLFYTVLIMSLPVMLVAQPPEGAPENEQIRTQRVAFITQRLNLTGAETGHFWTIYSEYEEQTKVLKRSLRRQNDITPSSDEEAYQIFLQRMDIEEQLLALKRSTFEQLREHVSPQKLILLPKAEREFRQKLVRQLRERRGNGRRG